MSIQMCLDQTLCNIRNKASNRNANNQLLVILVILISIHMKIEMLSSHLLVNLQHILSHRLKVATHHPSSLIPTS